MENDELDKPDEAREEMQSEPTKRRRSYPPRMLVMEDRLHSGRGTRRE